MIIDNIIIFIKITFFDTHQNNFILHHALAFGQQLINYLNNNKI